MRIIDKLRRFSLVAMIILSLFLSWKIWTNSGNKERVSDKAISEGNATLKQPQDVFLPVKLIYHDSEGLHKYTNKENLIAGIVKEIGKVKLEQFAISSQKDSKKYFGSQMTPTSVELVMSSPLALNYFLKINGQEIDRAITDNMKFQRIVLTLDQGKIFFLNDENHQVYQMRYAGTLSEVKSLLKDPDNRYLPVDHNETEEPVLYYYKEDLVLKKYSYILATQSYTTFSKAFFDNDQEIFSNDMDKDSKDVNLYNIEGSNLNVRYETGEVNFNGRTLVNDNQGDDRPSMFTDTFYYVQKIGNSMGTIRYFEGAKDYVIYRNFVEGFPIFSDYSKGRIEVAKANQNTQISTNQETIQVPIPSDQEVVLENTVKTLAKIEKLGIVKTELEDLQIGYTWMPNSETKQVVDLVPEWYAKINGRWLNLEGIERLLKEKAGEK